MKVLVKRPPEVVLELLRLSCWLVNQIPWEDLQRDWYVLSLYSLYGIHAVSPEVEETPSTQGDNEQV